MSDTLLPPNATAFEIAVERAVTTPPLPVPNATLWNPDTCPEALLPWLAHALSVDLWNPDWPEEWKRRSIRESVQVHRKKGTVASIRRALAALGLTNVRIYEKYGTPYDGSRDYDGSIIHEGADHWAEYRVYIDSPMTIARGAEVREVLAATAPVRCHLVGLFFTEAANAHDGAILYDGTFAHGVA